MAWLSDFAYPWLFCALVAPVALLILYGYVGLRRRRRLSRYSRPELSESAVPNRPPRLRHLPMVLCVLGLIFLTVEMAGPLRDNRIPRNRAVVVLALDVSESMRSTDVEPTRLLAAVAAAKQFATQLTPGVNLGVVTFSGTAELLVSPTPAHDATIHALDNLRTEAGTATGEGIFAALQAISTVSALLDGGSAKPTPAQIVLLSDGAENRPMNPNDPRGALTAARSAKAQGVPASTIAFGTAHGFIEMGDRRVLVPVDDSLMQQVAEASGGRTYHAEDVDELGRSYAAVKEQLGYETRREPGTTWWLYIGGLLCAAGVLASAVIHRRAPV